MTIAELRYFRCDLRMSYREISFRTGIPLTTIATRCQRLKIHPDEPIVAAHNWRKRPPLIKHGNIEPRLIEYLYWKKEKSTQEVADILDIPKRSLITLMGYHGIARRSRSEARNLVERNKGIVNGERNSSKAANVI